MNLNDFRPVDITTKKQAEAICGTLSSPSKMPCHGFSIPAQACQVGSKLRKIPGSVCANCYALKGNYQFPGVKRALEQRLGNLYHPQWVEAISFLIRRTGEAFFRWHDSGDLQSLAHLINIVRVAEALPDVQFWLPTREKKLVNEYARAIGPFPGNLTVRLSAAMVGAEAPAGPTNSVVRLHGAAAAPGQHACPAPRQGNKCGSCRACWDPAVAVVSYEEH